MKVNKIFLCSLGSLAVLSATAVSAQEIATAPSLEGGWSAMIGTMYMVPSVNDQAYNSNTKIRSNIPRPIIRPLNAADINVESDVQNFQGEYDLGIEAAIGYVFDNTANGIELSYRNFDSSSDGSVAAFEDVLVDFPPVFAAVGTTGIDTNQDNRYENFDLMVSQFFRYRFTRANAFLRRLVLFI